MRARAFLILSLLAISGLVAPTSVVAQNELEQLEAIEVTESLHGSLVLLQEQWLQWLTAYHQRDRDRAELVMADILITMRDLGATRSADLSFGVIVTAVQAARGSDFERAEWALEAAELLDARRPEVAFAAATIARLDGRRLAALGHQVRGYYRLLWFPWERSIVAQDVLLWVLYILVLSSSLFIVLLARTKAPLFYSDLVEVYSRRLSPTLAQLGAIATLLFPLVLPNGLIWLLLLWTVAFWGYSARNERIVLVCVWLLLGLIPAVVTEQRMRMTVRMSPAVRAMENLMLSRVEGSLLTDLGNLRVVLPESEAVKQLVADVHSQLGQWEFARALYLDVVDAEPDNAEAIVNLGAFYFHVADYAGAIQLFQRASADSAVAAAAYFNLSQSYSASYLFDESETALRTARLLDEGGVSEWVRRSEEERIVTVGGGLARVEEINEELEAALDVSREGSFLGRVLSAGSMRLAILVALFALGFSFFARRAGFYHGRPSTEPERSEDDEQASLAEILIPGVEPLAKGHAVRAFLSLLLPVALLTLPIINVLGYRVPWGYEPGGFLVWAIAGIGILIYVSLRVVRGLRA